MPSTIQTQFETRRFVRKDAETHKAMHAALILDNSYNSKFCSDISRVDYGKYKGPYLHRNQIPCLRELFCDNVMLFKLVPSNSITGNFTPECGDGTTVINRCLKEFCKNRGIKFHGKVDARRTVDLSKKTPEKTEAPPEGVDDDEAVFRAMEQACTKNIVEILTCTPSIGKRYRARRSDKAKHKYGYVSYKIPFAEYSYTDALDFCTEYANDLADNDIYVHEQDFTMDFGCSFNKAEMFMHLADCFGDSENYTLIDNDRTVGRNCLSFMHRLHTCSVRGKIYNKLAQSLETRNIKDRIGMHLDDLVNNTEDMLRETMLRSLDYGLTRLEITFYTGTVHPQAFYDAEMEHLCDLTLGSRKMFQAPIADQWRAFAESLTCNMAIIDLDTKEYALGMWCNTLTRRVGGVRGKLEDSQFEDLDRLTTWIAAHFSFDRGIINIATVKADTCPFDTEEEIAKWKPTTTLCLKSFVKSGEERATFLPGGKKGCLWYSRHIDPKRWAKSPRDKTPPERGIVDCPNVQFRIFGKRMEMHSKLLCECTQIDPICTDISTNTLRQRTKKIAVDIDLATVAESMASLTIKNKQAIADAATQIAEARAKKQFLSQCVFRNPRSLLVLPHNTVVDVVAFKEFASEYGPSYSIMDTSFQPYRATAYLSACIKNNRHLVPFDSTTGVYHACGTPVFRFRRGGDYFTVSKHRAPETTGFSGIVFIEVQDDLPEVPVGASIPYTNVPLGIKHKDAYANVDTLFLNTTYVLQGLRGYVFRNIQKYMLLIDGKYYASNYWLEDNLQKIDTETGLTNYEVLLQGGVQTTLLTYTKKTVPDKNKIELRCAAL